MDTTAVSLPDIISKKHSIKWKDYYLLKSLVRNAYLSESLSYSEKVSYHKLSVLNYMCATTEHVYISVSYNPTEESYVAICFIH